jgi:hypothetical protein
VIGKDRWVMGGGAAVLLVVLLPLWGEFREPGNLIWNMILGALLIVIATVVFFLQRHLQKHIGEVGEARFDTTNKKHDG